MAERRIALPAAAEKGAMARKKDPTASNQDPSSRGKPHRLKQPKYLSALFDKMLPLYPERRALEATTAAFAILNSEYPDIAASLVGGSLESIERAEADATPTHPALLDVTHLYWFERRVYERKSNAEFNAELVNLESQQRSRNISRRRARPVAAARASMACHRRSRAFPSLC